MSFTTEEVNLLVYGYLREAGFTHTAFIFAFESELTKSPLGQTPVPPASLLTVVQKGLLFTQAEFSAGKDGMDKVAESLSLLDAVKPSVLASKLKEANAKADAAAENGKADEKENSPPEGSGEVSSTVVVPATVLLGHEKDVFICSWNPTKDLLVSGAGDSTARIWDMSDDCKDPNASQLVLRHTFHGEEGGKKTLSNKDVTALCWNSDGKRLGTGCFDGFVRIWTTGETEMATLGRHKGPVFALKWNKRGNYMVTAGGATSVIWDATIGLPKQNFTFHKAPILDIDWQDHKTFASCSMDRTIQVCRIGSDKPVKSFVGHENEVNTIQWDPRGNLLASCSDDMTVKIWSLKLDTPVHTLAEHTKEIHMVKWSPGGPEIGVQLASASSDFSVKLWDIEKGACLRTLLKHSDSVYSVAYSPDGKMLATGSYDKLVLVWCTQTGQLLYTYEGAGSIFEVCWNLRGNKVAASASDGSVYMLDLRKV